MHLSPPEQKIAAKVLSDEGYSTRRIEALLGVDNVTVWRATQQATPDDLKQFETDFAAALTEVKKQGISLVHKRLLELIPEEYHIDQLIKAGLFLEGKQNFKDDRVPRMSDVARDLDGFIVKDEMKMEFVGENSLSQAP